ncbi:MAG: ribosomal-protein-alanine N-acetyltransferase [Ruminococcaceae bacterium]|nr:ribosomal-protein-alanine N-acetyltransferase [Oscillospiraceae bacterium]
MQKVLFVCTGNTCRSPMAQACANIFFENNDIDAKAYSCGLAAGVNDEASPNAVQAVKERYGIDFSHRAVQINEQLITDSDVIVGMSRHHAETVFQLYPHLLKGKILISMPRDIPDPYGQDIEIYRKALDVIHEGIHQLFNPPEEPEMSDFTVELFEPKWAKELFEIEKQCFSTPWCEDEFTNLDKNEFATAFVALKEDKPVGFTVIYRVADEAQIMDIATHPAHRREGIAEALMDVAIDYSRTDGASKMMLEVRRSNTAAQKLYQKKGFKTVGTRRDYYTCPTEDAVLYDLEL